MDAERAAAKTAIEIGPNKGNVTAANGAAKDGAAQKNAVFPRLGFGAIPGAGATTISTAAASSRPR